MTEVTCTRKDHRHTTLIGSGNNFFVTHAAAGLNHTSCARIDNHI
jgi:hypothetical protein